MALALGARDRRFESCHPDKVSKFEDALAQITEEHAIRVFAASYGKCDAIKRFNLPMNGTGCRIVDALISKFAIDVSHFDPSKQNRRYERVIRQCPTCSKPFVTSIGHRAKRSRALERVPTHTLDRARIIRTSNLTLTASIMWYAGDIINDVV